MKGESIPHEELEEQEQRTALGRLQGTGRHGAQVGSIRVGSVKLGGPGTLPPSSLSGGLAFKQPLRPAGNNNKGAAATIQIFQDENGAPPPPPLALSRGGQTGARSTGGAHSATSISSGQIQKENELPAAKWSQAKSGPKQANIPLDKIGQYAPKAAFTVHEDAGPPPTMSCVTPHKLLAPGTSNVLTAHKAARQEEEVLCPVALFEPPDPTKRPMYCKEKIYQGASEVSFEELRAMKWRARHRERIEREQAAERERAERERLAEEKQELERRRLEILERERQLREQQEAMARQMEEFRQMMAANARSQAPGLTVTRPSSSSEGGDASYQGGAAGRCRDPGNNQTADSIPPSESSSLKYSMEEDTARLLAANPSGAKTKPVVAATPSPHGNKVTFFLHLSASRDGELK